MAGRGARTGPLPGWLGWHPAAGSGHSSVPSVQGHIAAAKSAKRHMERAAVDADKAQSRFLGHDLGGRFRQRSPEQTEAARIDMDHAQVPLLLA